VVRLPGGAVGFDELFELPGLGQGHEVGGDKERMVQATGGVLIRAAAFTRSGSRVDGCHGAMGVAVNGRMKSITIRELHEQTAQVVHRAAAEEGFVITEGGEAVAILKPARGWNPHGRPLPKRDPSTLPTTQFDSTAFVSDERSGR